ncbi:heterokaryon incompatibility protein-domain-containing protein [Bisporella sp. PMI_857]|nr:heterokaryon incompatibility protein-domain-containing protein [Bisporella sp. PMI_857]
MRLINTETYEVKEFIESYDESFGVDLPFYVILSHTWGVDEVTFEDVERGNFKKKKGFQKLEGFCRMARSNGFSWAWMDTCCIDKRNSTELSEAINSMFAWYKRSLVCYVYLDDFDGFGDYGRCRWFTRGWTLQELISPRMVVFFNRDWKDFGERSELAERISQVTWIDEALLRSQSNLSDFSVAEKMRWASRRKTTRVEDGSYSLLGLFNVNIPLLYGEGHAAFYRLQEEIIKSSSDLSMFVWWKPWGVSTLDSNTNWGLFASSPAFFELADGVVPKRMLKGETTEILASRPFNITNTGLQIQLDCTLQDSALTDLGITSQASFLKADLECVHRRDRRLKFFLALALRGENCVPSLFDKAKPKLAAPLNAIRCHRVHSLCEGEENIGQGVSINRVLLLPLMIYPLRGSQTLKSVIPQSMKFDSSIVFDNGVSSYQLVFQEGGDYGRGFLAQQGLSRFSTNACFFVFRNAHGKSFSLKVVVDAMPHFQAFNNVLCFFKDNTVVNSLSWQIQVSDGKPLPAKFEIQSGKLVSVSARYSVGKTGLRQLKLHVSVDEPNIMEGIISGKHSDREQTGDWWVKPGARPPLMHLRGVPVYFGPPVDSVTKTPLRPPRNGDYFQS